MKNKFNIDLFVSQTMLIEHIDSLSDEDQKRIQKLTENIVKEANKDPEMAFKAIAFLFLQSAIDVYFQNKESIDLKISENS